jgi:gas vesicle protein
MMKTVKGMMIGMGVAAAAAMLLWKSPTCRQAMEDKMQDAIDKAEELKDSLGK